MKIVVLCYFEQKLTLKFRTLSLLHIISQHFGIFKLHLKSSLSVLPNNLCLLQIMLLIRGLFANNTVRQSKK
jgi:hypothetical protein